MRRSFRAGRRRVDRRRFAPTAAFTCDPVKHSEEVFGPWFFSGQRVVIVALETLGADAPEMEVFRLAVQRLRRRMGELNMMVHSQFVRKRLWYFVRKLQPLRVAAVAATRVRSAARVKCDN
jgi:hypothetical protein